MDYLCIIVMFLSAVWTLILMAPIHCRASIAETLMQRHISPNLMKKLTHLDVISAGQASRAGSLGTQVSLCSLHRSLMTQRLSGESRVGLACFHDTLTITRSWHTHKNPEKPSELGDGCVSDCKPTDKTEE